MIPTNVEILDLPNGSKLVKGILGTSGEKTCFNCHKFGYHSWQYLTKVVLDEYTLLVVCDGCCSKIKEWVKKLPIPLTTKIEDNVLGRMVDLK